MGINRSVIISLLVILLILSSCQTIQIQCADGKVVSDVSLCSKAEDKKETPLVTEVKKCPSSCDDDNDCTADSCSKDTLFKCVNSLKEGCNKKEDILKLKANEIVLSSSQVEAGYSLDRDFSGRVWFKPDEFDRVKQLGIIDSFIKGFYKSGVSGADERSLYFYGYTFESKEGADSYYHFLLNESLINYSFIEEKKCSGFDDCLILSKTYKGDFVKQKKFDALIRQKNAVVEIIFTGQNEKIHESELDYYFPKLESNFEKGSPDPMEVPIDKVSTYNSERTALDIDIVSMTSGYSIPKASDYYYYDLESLPSTGDSIYKFVNIKLKNLDDQSGYTIEGTNYNGFYPGPESFSLEDKSGNTYSVHQYTFYLDGFNADLEIKKGQEIRTRLAFLVPKESTEFTLYAYDWPGTQIAEVDLPKK